MSEEDGLIYACRFDGKGGAEELDWDAIATFDGSGVTWVHLHLEGAKTRDWLQQPGNLPEIVVEALQYEETRPRCTPLGDGLLVNLRGVNLNPGADPEDMVQMRLYIDKSRIVSVRRRRLMAVQDIRDRLESGKGPDNTADFLVEVTTRLIERMGPVIADLDDAIDDIEDRVLTQTDSALRGELWHARHQAIALRRYIAPQRDAMARLVTERVSWIEPHIFQRLREVADRITRYVEDLDAGRERAAIVQDELNTRLSEQMNRNMYVLSVIAGIFLPLTLLTGLLGINVGGIPGEKWPWSFTAVVAGTVILGYIEYILFRRLKWI